jgi:hypothetical protein
MSEHMTTNLVLKQNGDTGLHMLDRDTAGEIDARLEKFHLAEIAKVIAGSGGDKADGVAQSCQVVGGYGR